MSDQYKGAVGQLGYVGFHFHKWSKWEQYQERGTMYGWAYSPTQAGVPYSENRQRRHCLICNYQQDKKITES